MRRTFELKRIGAFRAANILAVVSFVVYGIVALVMVPLFLLLAVLMPQAEDMPPTWLFALLPIVYPVMGAVFGWIGGGLAALAYNLVVRWTGGLEVDVEEAG